MLRRSNLGEFEELVLLLVASIGSEAYAINIRNEMMEQAKRSVNISAVHAALYRLEDKGFLKSKLGGATQKRGGKQKRYFQVTHSGFGMLKESKRIREDLWNTIPQLSVVKTS